MSAKGGNRERPELELALASLRLQRSKGEGRRQALPAGGQTSLDRMQGAEDSDTAFVELNVGPPQSEYLALAQAERDGDREERFKAMSLGVLEQLWGLRFVERPDDRVLGCRQGHVIRYVVLHESPFTCAIQGRPQDVSDVDDRRVDTIITKRRVSTAPNAIGLHLFRE